MRELGFSVLWAKLAKPTTTTFRFTRKDRDWQESEVVKVVYKPRSKQNRSVLGVALIEKKQSRWVVDRSMVAVVDDISTTHYGNALIVTNAEAKIDGFQNHQELAKWMSQTYNGRNYREPMNRLTINWQERWLYTKEQKPHIAKQWANLLGDGNE